MVKCAQKKGHSSPEDIAQEYVCRLLQGLHSTATVDQAYIDIMRLTSGRKGLAQYDEKNTLNSLVSEKQMDAIQLIPGHSSDLNVDELIDLQAILQKIKHPQSKKVFLLKIEGWTNSEIGNRLGVGEARISQILIKEINRLSGKV